MNFLELVRLGNLGCRVIILDILPIIIPCFVYISSFQIEIRQLIIDVFFGENITDSFQLLCTYQERIHLMTVVIDACHGFVNTTAIEQVDIFDRVLYIKFSLFIFFQVVQSVCKVSGNSYSGLNISCLFGKIVGFPKIFNTLFVFSLPLTNDAKISQSQHYIGAVVCFYTDVIGGPEASFRLLEQGLEKIQIAHLAVDERFQSEVVVSFHRVKRFLKI